MPRSRDLARDLSFPLSRRERGSGGEAAGEGQRAGHPVGTELLDDRHADPDEVRRQLNDIARLNRLFGGTRAVVKALDSLFRKWGRAAGNRQRLFSLLDVGTGAGDIPVAVVRAAQRHGVRIVPLGLDSIPAAVRVAHRVGVHGVIGDGNAPPFAPKSVDIVVASQVLHHLPPSMAIEWIRRFDALARRAVVLADLYRSRWAMMGVWLAAFPLGMNHTTRHDAVLSLRRGYRLEELHRLLEAAGVRASVYRRPLARVVAMWEPCPHASPLRSSGERDGV